jgi:DNA uptake protein ComE-like DNA-binding protein
LQNAAQQLGTALTGNTGNQITRNGMDLSAGGKVKINSLYELIGAQVQTKINGVNTTLDSPWSDEPSQMASYLPDLFDKLTITAEKYIEGRINVNQAHKEVLLGIPNMTPVLADAIVAAQANLQNGASSSSGSSRLTTGWLVSDGLTDLATLTQLDPYITARGDVYRAQIVGHFDAGGPMTRVEAVIDATQVPPQVIFFRDLTELGSGYSLQSLLLQQ